LPSNSDIEINLGGGREGGGREAGRRTGVLQINLGGAKKAWFWRGKPNENRRVEAFDTVRPGSYIEVRANPYVRVRV
jgi:hypothetical protein